MPPSPDNEKKTELGDEMMVVDSPVGVKFDLGKLRYDLLPPDALADIVSVFTYGAKKYADRNWEKGMAFSRIYAAMQRHLNAYWAGQDLDEESALPHLAHAGFGILALLHLHNTRPECDDRPTVVTSPADET